MIYKVTNSDGVLIRSGICQLIDLEWQAGPGEVVSESTASEIAELTQSLAAEAAVAGPGTVKEFPAEEPASPPLPPIDLWVVMIRALEKSGVVLDLEAARAELTAEIAMKRAESTARRITSRAGVADPVSLAVLAVLAVLALAAPSGVKPGQKHFWEFWKKNPVEQVNKAQTAVDAAKAKADADAAAAAAAVNAEREKQLKLAQEAAHATGTAIAAAQVTATAGAIPVRELETARQINSTNTQAMDQALGAADPARLRELEAMVRDLNTGVAAGAKALELLNGSLEKTVTEKAALQVKLEQLDAENKTAIAAAEKLRNDATEREQTWSLERDGVARSYERIWFWGKIAAAGAALLIVYVLFLFIRVRGLTNFGKDAVGMTEMLKREFQQRVAPEEFAALKEKIRSDWMTTHDGTAQLVDKFKAQLRL